MNAVSADRLDRLYADSSDPWCHRASIYEQRKYAASIAALASGHYAAILEIGCGNGEFARHLTPLASRYVGVDAVAKALAAARKAVPEGDFRRVYLPDRLPSGSFDLIVISEFLYFLDADGVRQLAAQICERWPDAEILVVNYRGPSGNFLQGDEAAALFANAVAGCFHRHYQNAAPRYRIDVFIPRHRDFASWRRK